MRRLTDTGVAVLIISSDVRRSSGQRPIVVIHKVPSAERSTTIDSVEDIVMRLAVARGPDRVA